MGNALPILAVVARAEQKLRSDVNRSFLVGRKRDRRVPVVTQLLLVVRARLDVTGFVRIPIHPRDLAALILGINEVGIRRVGKHPESVAVVHVFPALIRDAAGILRIADP